MAEPAGVGCGRRAWGAAVGAAGGERRAWGAGGIQTSE